MADRRYIEDMRRNLGLKADDASRDEHINSMTPEQRLKLLCGWHFGDRNWAHNILNWVEDCGFKLTPKRT